MYTVSDMTDTDKNVFACAITTTTNVRSAKPHLEDSGAACRASLALNAYGAAGTGCVLHSCRERVYCRASSRDVFPHLQMGELYC